MLARQEVRQIDQRQMGGYQERQNRCKADEDVEQELSTLRLPADVTVRHRDPFDFAACRLVSTTARARRSRSE
ncbi:MAG: hypothetical protein WDO24_04880 [Pseudomonadota bacterium]